MLKWCLCIPTRLPVPASTLHIFPFYVWVLQEQLVPTCRPTDILPVFRLVGIECSEVAGCESWTSTISFAAFFQPRLYVMGLFPDEPWSPSQFLLSWSQGYNFLFALLLPLRVLNSHISREWKSRLPLTFTFLTSFLVCMKSSKAPLHSGSFLTWVRKLSLQECPVWFMPCCAVPAPANTSVIEVYHEDQDL